MATRVVLRVTYRFAGIHRWPTAPDGDTAFLRYPHRHIFHVTLGVVVAGLNRELEFLQLQERLRVAISAVGSFSPIHVDVTPGVTYVDLDDLSCEMLATRLFTEFTTSGYEVTFVEVSEDGENGARIEEVPCTPKKKSLR